jgi:hypothetical protein
MALYAIYNGPAPTTAAQVKVTTGTVIKTMLQLRATRNIKIVEWGISFDGSAAATPIACELLATGTVFATVTAHVDAGIHKYNPGSESAVGSVAGITFTTTGTGYTATAEGSITTSRMFDAQLIAPTNQYVKQFPLGREPIVFIGQSGRIRVTAGAAVNAICYTIIEV